MEPPAPGPEVAPQQVAALYRSWRWRQFSVSYIGYAVFYFVRKNLPVAMPLLEKALGISKTQLGLFLTLHDLLYGVSKFRNGFLADRTNPRYFMALGLFLSALMNLGFGLSSGLFTLGGFWLLNGWFQGMGFPPCARVLSRWFGTDERGVIWGLWNSSHQVGAALILILAGALGQWQGWRAVFLGPALIAMAVSVFLAVKLRDTPESLGLPPIARYRGGESLAAEPASATADEAQAAARAWKRVAANPAFWAVCTGNFFVYLIRYGIMNWAPTYLNQARGHSLTSAGTLVAGFEVAGLLGSILGGWLTDRFFGGRRAPLCTFYMLATLVSLLWFWKLPPGSVSLDVLVLLCIGFMVYGPQFLVGVIAVDLATYRAAGSAIGMTGLFGYASSALSGVGFGWVVTRYGWDGGFRLLVASACAATVCFALAWNIRPEKAVAEKE